jgi:hypothetical protein
MLLVTEHNLLSKELTSHFTPNTLIADSGATCHMHGSIEGMSNLKAHVTDIMVGNKESLSSLSKGNYRGLVTQKDGYTFDVILQDVLYIPRMMVNLFSLHFVHKVLNSPAKVRSSRFRLARMIRHNLSTWFWLEFGY